jgi:hypothetical protein
MNHLKISGPVLLILVMGLALLCTGCFNSGNSTANTTNAVVKPAPKVEKVVATTSGTQSAYFATLDITVHNGGAEGTILVQASITQNGKTSSNEMPVYLKQNESHELKLTFPLVWEGGEFTSTVNAITP